MKVCSELETVRALRKLALRPLQIVHYGVVSFMDLMARSIVVRSTFGRAGKLQVLHGLVVGLLGRQVKADLV